MQIAPALYPYPAQASPAEARTCQALIRATLKLYTLVCMRSVRVHVEAAWPAGPKLIALNHANGSDGFALPFIFPDPLVALAQADLFRLPVLGRWITAAGWVPVAPGQGQAALAAARRHLEQGRSLVICPEGRLNHGGPLHRGGIGTVRLALDTGAPIVPLGCYVPPRFTRAIHGSSAGRATMGRWQIGGPLYVEVGAALWPRRMAGGDSSHGRQRRLTEALMARIGALVEAARQRAEG